jgi:hypothetical protein
MRVKETTTAPATSVAERPSGSGGVQLGTIVALLADGTPQVQIGRTRTAGRLAVRVSRERVETAIALQQQVVLQFENGDSAKPIIMGFIERLEEESPQPVAAAAPVIEADIDGKRVRLTAHDEIILQCGNASITLRRNGRVIVRGTYVETNSDGTNRIKGGQVQIN